MTWVDKYFGAGIDYVELAIPFFLLLIALEVAVGWWQGRQLYRLHDSITDLSCGILDQVVSIFMKSLLLAAYLFLYEHARLMEMTDLGPTGKWLAAITLFIAVDFCFYWFHRFAHEWALPWGAHAVHHQSEEFNLAVALRQSATEGCFAWVFYLPLALMGFPPLWYLAMASINLVYQFWIHTRVIGTLGPLERVLNTPSHHRVHHGRNPKYLDKNYAGMLIIWDRMFGTFCPEQEEPVYGITRPLESWNPLWAHVQVWVEMFRDAQRATRWGDKIRIWFMPLGWRPAGLPPRPQAPDVSRDTSIQYETPLTRGLNLYVAVQFVGVLVLSLLIGHWDDTWPANRLVVPALLVVLTTLNLGGILERRRWAFASELGRAALVAAGAWVWVLRHSSAAVGIGYAVTLLITAVLTAVWLWAYRSEFRDDIERESAPEHQ